MKNLANISCSNASVSSSEHRPWVRGSLALLGLLVGLSACAGPLDPIITEQPEDRDPTTDPRDGSALRGSMTEAHFAFALTPDQPSRLS